MHLFYGGRIYKKVFRLRLGSIYFLGTGFKKKRFCCDPLVPDFFTHIGRNGKTAANLLYNWNRKQVKPLDLKRIVTSLETIFNEPLKEGEARKIVFWQDYDKSFAKEIHHPSIA